LNSVAILDECVKEDAVFLAVEHCSYSWNDTTSMFSTRIWQPLLVSVILTLFTKFTCYNFSHFLLQKEIATKQPSLLGVLVLLHQWLIFRDGSLIVGPIAIANASLCYLKKMSMKKSKWLLNAVFSFSLFESYLFPH